jgi:hypothetical protein
MYRSYYMSTGMQRVVRTGWSTALALESEVLLGSGPIGPRFDLFALTTS